MALNDLIATLVGVADRLTAGVQATVRHYPHTGFTTKGEPEVAATYDAVRCVVEYGRGRTTTDMRTGEQVPLKAVLTFPRPLAVTMHDKFVLPDFSTGPVVSIDGVVNPGTGGLYATTVTLGGQLL